MQYLDKDYILNSLTKDDVKKIMIDLGSNEPKTDSNGNYIFQTICHNYPKQDNSYKLYYYHEPSGEHKGKVCHCYTQCSCSSSIIDVVIKAKKIQGKNFTWYKALRYIAQITDKLDDAIVDEGDIPKNTIIDDFSWINPLKYVKNKKRKNIPVLEEINENVLDVFAYLSWIPWMKENINEESMRRFEISYYGLNNSIIIPHRDMNGRLIGIRQRWIDEDDIDRIGKYTPLMMGNNTYLHSLGSNLYGLHISKNKIKRLKKVMVVEAEKSCLQAYSYYGDDSFVVSVCGSNITDTQIKILLELDVNEVIIGFDRDYKEPDSFMAERYYRKLLKKALPLTKYFNVYLCLDNKDRISYKSSPTDFGKEMLNELLEEKFLVTTEYIKNYFIDCK